MVDALCCTFNSRASSIVELQLNSCFERCYSSISRAIEGFYKPRSLPAGDPKADSMLEEVKQKLQSELITHLPKKEVCLFALDTTSIPRCHAKTLSDRYYTHNSTSVPGQKPITVGHAYSAACYLAEKDWALPLSIERVSSDENKVLKGMEQLIGISRHEHFEKLLTVCCADSAYCCAGAICTSYCQENVVLISRMKNNRVVYKRWESPSQKKKGRPKKYGKKCHLSEELGPSNSSVILSETTKKGRELKVHISSWDNHLLRGERRYPLDDKPVRIIKVSVCDDKGSPIYRYPLWLCVSGKQAGTLALAEIYQYYRQRFDIEYFFKFGKTRLLMNAFQTPETEHESNWMQIVMLASHMLYHAKPLADQTYRPWESSKAKQLSTANKTPFQVFRAMPNIISQVGTPACPPKKRGIPSGREENTTMNKRTVQPIVCKSKTQNDQLCIKFRVQGKQGTLNLQTNSNSEHNGHNLTVSQEVLMEKIETKLDGLGVQAASP